MATQSHGATNAAVNAVGTYTVLAAILILAIASVVVWSYVL
jgi:hypothetical protein